MDQRDVRLGAQAGQNGGTGGVGAIGGVGVGFRCVDGGICGGVDHKAGGSSAEGRLDGVRAVEIKSRAADSEDARSVRQR